MKSMIEVVREFIKSCPYLVDFEKGMNVIGVDFLGEDPETYTIENVPVDPVVKEYIDGSCEKRFAFVFASKEYYGKDAMLNIENIGFYEDFSLWLKKCTMENHLPKLEGGRSALKIEATLTPYLFEVEPGADVARYQIQCVMHYYEPALTGI